MKAEVEKETEGTEDTQKFIFFVQTVASNMTFGVLFKPAELWNPHPYNLNRNDDYLQL